METYIGKVFDLDFIEHKGTCQALILRDGDIQNIVVETAEHRMQTLLETALGMGRDVEVTYTLGPPNLLTRVKLNIPEPPQ